MKRTDMKRRMHGNIKAHQSTQRLIRHALSASLIAVTGFTVTATTAHAASVNANGTSVTIDNNNINTGGTLDQDDTVIAQKPAGSVSIINGTTITGNSIIASRTGASITIDDLTADIKGHNGRITATGGANMSITDSSITGTYEAIGPYPLAPPGQGIFVVEATGAGSTINLDNVTLNVDGHDPDRAAHQNNYYSAGVSVYSGGTINLTDTTINADGERTRGIWTQADGGTVVGHNVNITTTGDSSSVGVAGDGANSSITLDDGSTVTTTGANSSAVQLRRGSHFSATDTTITTENATSAGIELWENSSADIVDSTVTAADGDGIAVAFGTNATGSFTANNSTLNGDIISASTGSASLKNGSTLNGNVSMANGSFFISADSVWNHDGGDSVMHDFTNNGEYTVTPLSPTADPADASSYGSLTVDNFHAGAGSSIIFNIFDDGENSMGDVIIINNQYDGAPTYIEKQFTNGGVHAMPEDGLVLVQGSNPGAFQDGDFYDPSKQGIYTYYGNYVVDPANGNPQFRLYSQLNSAVAAVSALPALGASVALSALPTVQDRMHAPRDSVTGTGQGAAQRGIWARLFGGSTQFTSDSGSKTGFDNTLWALQAGYDLMAKTDAKGGKNYAGLYLGYGNSSGDAQINRQNVGRLKLNATTLGAYWTKYTPKNAYLSVTGQYSWLNGIRASGDGEEVRPDGNSFLVSLEGGQTLRKDKSVSIEPQAQLIYQRTKIDDVTLRAAGIRPEDTHLSLSSMNSVIGRLGVLFQQNSTKKGNLTPWARVNLWHQFSGSSSVSAPLSDSVRTSAKGTSLEARVGAYILGDANSRFSFDVDGGYMFDVSGAKNKGWRGSIGTTYKW